MAPWTKAELSKIDATDELHIASLTADGRLRKAVTIWVVRLGDDLYVRSVNGRSGAWFRWTQVRHAGHVRVGGIDKDVTFADADPALYDQVDAAYRTKYRKYPTAYVDSVLTPQARLATLRLVPA